jgi:exodeoxyribonuclease III
MRIATWNVNGLRARLDFMKIWLQQRQPDVVGLQELKVTEDEFPAEEFRELGYEVSIHSQKGWNGVGVLSKTPMETITCGLPGEEEMGARLITVNVEGLSFTTVYVPNGKSLTHEDFPRKLAWLETLAAHWRNTTDINDQAVICGDFNVVPAAIDSWRGEKADGGVFHTVEERSRLAALTQTGLFDIYREKYPDEQMFSWWDYRGGAFHRKMGLRIDFVYGTSAVLDRVSSVEIDREFRKKKDGLTASDHAPVIVDLA